MNLPTRHQLLLLALSLSLPSALMAADCATIFSPSMKAEDAYKLKSQDIQTCVHQGWDPPPALLPDMSAGVSGSRAGGSGGFSAGTIQAPEVPPAAAGAGRTAGGGLCFSYGGFSVCGNININPGQIAKQKTSTTAGGTGTTGSTSGTGGTTSATASDSSTATIDDAGNVTLPSNVCPITSGDALVVTNNVTKQSYYGVFGPNTWFSSAASLPLSCGGAVPLNNFQLSLVQNPTHLVRIEQWVEYLWLYKANANNYQQLNQLGAPSDNPIRLPKWLCEEVRDKDGNVYRRKSTTPPPSYTPIGQMITYNNDTKRLALQLMMQPTSTTSDLYSPMDPKGLYLLLPINNGIPYVPRDGIRADGSINWNECDLQKYFLRPYAELKNDSNLSPDMMITSSMQSSCSASKAVCEKMGMATPPTTPANCETHALFPEIASNPALCEGRVQHFGLDHPNLYFPPGTSVSAKPFVDSKGVQWPKFPSAKKTGDPTVDFYMVSTTAGSAQNPPRLVVSSDSTIQLGQSNNVFMFPNGATIADINGDRIVMRANATLDMKNLVATMPNGGARNSKAGVAKGTFPDGATYKLSGLPLPMVVKISRDMNMPAGFVIPTQSSALVRQPSPAAD